MAALFGLFGLPANVVRIIAAWKEAALIVLCLIAVLRAISGRGPRVRIAWADLWIGGLAAVGVAYLIGENTLLRTGLPKSAEMLGFRDAIYFLLIYFVGRSTPQLVEDDRTMRVIFALVLFTSIIGILEPFLIPPQTLVAIGVASYFNDFLGITTGTVGNDYGLPSNYWTVIGGMQFRRSGSIYLSGQGFAAPFLLFFPLVTAWVFARPKRSFAQIAGYAIVCLALLMTVTRMTIFIAVVQIVLFVAMQRRPEWAVAAVAISGMIFLGAFILIPGFPTFVWETLSWQSSSSLTHANDWANGLAAFAQNPWGIGLGTTDQASVRSGLPHITGDNLYLKYAVEMGVLGIGLLVLSIGSILGHSMALYQNATNNSQRRMGAAMWLATVGLVLNGMTAVVFNSPILAYLFFWLAGAVVTSSQRVAVDRHAAQPLLLRPVSAG
jgi:O-antigen ligase